MSLVMGSELRMLTSNATQDNDIVTIHPGWRFVDYMAAPKKCSDLCNELGISDQTSAENTSCVYYTPDTAFEDRGTISVGESGPKVTFIRNPSFTQDQAGFRRTEDGSQIVIWGDLSHRLAPEGKCAVRFEVSGAEEDKESHTFHCQHARQPVSLPRGRVRLHRADRAKLG